MTRPDRQELVVDAAARAEERVVSFGPCPRKCWATGAPAKATMKRRTMKTPPESASLSLLSRSQMPSQ